VVDCAIQEISGHALAQILPARGTDPAALGQALGVPLVDGPVSTGDAGLMVMGTAPRQWLVHAADAPAGWVEALGARLDPLAAVIDQSGAYVLFELSGSDAPRLLQKGLAIDLAALPPRAVTVGAIAGSGVILHGLHLFVARSHARSVRGWLDRARAGLAW
jgi:methylglutamate dehydrogenase subunit D